jgi:phosphoribosyl 1,2-cyclic phosphodiesterase
MAGMRFSVLASGSGGNSCYVETEGARVIVDAGLSCRELVRRLDLVGIDPETLNALIVTHEHSDHIKGAGPLVRRFDLPLYINRKTLSRSARTLGKHVRPILFRTGDALMINDLKLETFTKCHDAADPLGMVLSHNGARIGMATDLGRSTRLVEDRLGECRALILEFNYDPQMLESGPYPLELQRRIKGQDGHLSNQQAGDLLGSVTHRDLDYVVLAHLSETNNHPGKAREEAERALRNCGLEKTAILVSRQDEPGPMIEL